MDKSQSGATGDLVLPTLIPAEFPEGVEKDPKKLSLRVVASDEDCDCRFWIGLSSLGKNSPHALLNLSPIDEIFNRAALEGLTSPGPLMLSDCLGDRPKFIYFVPPPSESRSEDVWVADLYKSTVSWEPESIGIYFSPEILSPAQSNLLMVKVVREIILKSSIKKFYLLLGKHGLNSIVDAGHKLRMNLKIDKVSLSVFH